MRTRLLTLVPLAFLSLPAAAADIEALERQLDQARAEAPMVVKPFMAVARPAKYFGDYEPRKGNEFRKGEKMLFYGEPKNLTYPKNAEGLLEPAFEVDMEVKGPGGASLSQPKLMTFRLPTRSRAQDIFLNLAVNLTSAPAGAYNVKFVVRDLNSKKVATVNQDVTIK